MTTKRLFAIIIAIVMILTCFAGCSNQEQEQSKELEKNQTVTVYSWWDPTKPGLETLKKAFEEKYKDYNVTVDFVKVSGSYYQTMITKLAAAKLAGGSAEKIDVMMLAYDQLPFFAQNNQVMKLDGVISEEYLKTVYPSVKESLYYNGSLYAVPRDVTTWCTYLSAKLFKDNGIEIPGKDWTMEEFIGICKKFQEKGVFGFATNDYTDVLSPWLYLFGGQYFNAETGVSTLLSSKKGILELYHMMENDSAMTIAEARSNGKAQDAFIRGETAMFFGGLSDSGKLDGGIQDYVVLPLPSGVNGHQSHTFTNCWTIPTVSTQIEWGKKVVEFFSSAEGQKIAAENDMGMPAVSGIDMSKWVEAKPIRQYFLDALGYEKTVPYQTHLNGTNWGANSRSLLRDKIFNVPGLTDGQIETILAEMDQTLTYFLNGGV